MVKEITATMLEIPSAKDLDTYRKALFEEKNNEYKEKMFYRFSIDFNDSVLKGADSFRFIFPVECLPFKEELYSTVKELGYTCKLIDDDYYGYVLHVQLV